MFACLHFCRTQTSDVELANASHFDSVSVTLLGIVLFTKILAASRPWGFLFPTTHLLFFVIHLKSQSNIQFNLAFIAILTHWLPVIQWYFCCGPSHSIRSHMVQVRHRGVLNMFITFLSDFRNCHLLALFSYVVWCTCYPDQTILCQLKFATFGGF